MIIPEYTQIIQVNIDQSVTILTNTILSSLLPTDLAECDTCPNTEWTV